MKVRRALKISSAAIIALSVAMSLQAIVDDPSPKVTLRAERVGPRPLEAPTEKALARDYAAAWKTLFEARSANRSQALDAYFTGIAREKLGRGIEEQAKHGLTTRYVDQGHDVSVIFYSPDGASVQLQDVARFSVELLDGDKVVDKQEVQHRFIAVMTPAETRWKVRILEEDVE